MCCSGKTRVNPWWIHGKCMVKLMVKTVKTGCKTPWIVFLFPFQRAFDLADGLMEELSMQDLDRWPQLLPQLVTAGSKSSAQSLGLVRLG